MPASSNVINLHQHKQARQQQRLSLVLDALALPAEFPPGLAEEPGTGDLVASREAWAVFERVFEAFEVELPQDVNAHAAIGGVVYLAGHLGSKIKLRARDAKTYEMVQRGLTEAERSYIDALFGASTESPAALVKGLGVLQKRPSDFA